MKDMVAADATLAIPVYNGEEYLAQAIESVLAQTVLPEVIVYDNCSTDSTCLIAGRYLPRRHIRTSPVNEGASVNFNRGVGESTSEFFMWLAADDRLGEPEFTSLCIQALISSPDRDVALPSIVYIDSCGEPMGRQLDWPLASTNERNRLRAFLRRRRWTEVYCMYRRDALDRSPGFVSRYGADVLLSWWFLLRKPFVVVPDAHLEYRVPGPKTAAEMTQSLTPGASTEAWPKVELWKGLWALAGDHELPVRTRLVAKTELIGVCFSKYGLRHLREDFRTHRRRLRHRRSDRTRDLASPG